MFARVKACHCLRTARVRIGDTRWTRAKSKKSRRKLSVVVRLASSMRRNSSGRRMHGTPGRFGAIPKQEQRSTTRRGQRKRIVGSSGREGEKAWNIRESRRSRTGISNCLQRATGQLVVGMNSERDRIGERGTIPWDRR